MVITGFTRYITSFGPSDVMYRPFNLGRTSSAKLGLETTGEILNLASSRVTARKIRMVA